MLVSHNHYTWPVPLDDPESFAGKAIGGRDYQPEDGSEPIPTLGYWPALYHIRRDREEAYSLTDRHPERVKAMEEALVKWRGDFYKNPRGWK